MANSKNLANGIVSTDVGTTATTMVLQSGYGQYMPSTPFFLTCTPPGQLSTMGNSEVVQVTTRTSDTLTIVRAQKGTTAQNILTGWVVSNSVYTEDLSDLTLAIKNALYPIGTIYENISDSTNPSILLGFGTWAAIAGRVIVGVGTSDQAFPANATGGESKHTLSQAEMPSHTHGQYVTANSGSAIRKDYAQDAAVGPYDQGQQTQPTGGGGSHNNLQPYATAYIWQRTA